MRKVRIGIDVGGTFTDAVAIDDSTYKIIAREKLPTTHGEAGGVAVGVIRILQDILTKYNIAPDEVIFIAHGTTQATNALLEGDVAPVGILALGSGLEAGRAKSDSQVGDIPLSRHKALKTYHTFLETGDVSACPEEVEAALTQLQQAGAQVIVATEPFSVDHPENERFIIELARRKGLYATGGSEVSKLYGLKVRTRTAVINGSLIPKMMETADMTESCVRQAGIATPLMIMRCDGGVMTVAEVRRRPILTMLSGLAAGVAGALMYEHLSDGIFLEAGGTSTDISVVKNGRVMVRYAQVGGHKTYLNSLDVRTLGVAGGSLIRVHEGKITDIGPRSAHIAGLAYEAFAPALNRPRLVLLAPKAEDDAEFAAVREAAAEPAETVETAETAAKAETVETAETAETAAKAETVETAAKAEIVETTAKVKTAAPATHLSGAERRVALTLAGAANVLGAVPEGDYASGDKAAAQAAWQALGDYLGLSAREAAQQAMDLAAAKVGAVVEALIKDYELDRANLCLAGGGGSAGVVVPYLGQKLGCRWKIVRNAPIISTIGVALAMVREVVERTVLNPGQEDIASIRQEALERILKSGAGPATVEIVLEIDQQANILRAVATGATELRTRDLGAPKLTPEELRQKAAASLQLPADQVKLLAAVGGWHLFDGEFQTRRWGLWKKTHHLVRVLDRDGVIRLQQEACGVLITTKAAWAKELPEFLDLHTEYGTVGGQLPRLYAYFGEKQLDLSGLVSQEQIESLLRLELAGVKAEAELVIVAVKN